MQPLPAVPIGMPTWACLDIKPGAGRSAQPLLGQAGPEELGVLLLRGGGPGGGLVPRLGALSSWVPSPPPLAQEGSSTRTAEASSPPPTAASSPPSSRPASCSSHPPPSARFYGNWAMLAQTASFPCTPGDACLLHGACINAGGGMLASPSQRR